MLTPGKPAPCHLIYYTTASIIINTISNTNPSGELSCICASGDMLRVFTLGGGQDIGKSCIIVSWGIGDCTLNVMLDCGVHLGYKGNDSRLYPEIDSFGSLDKLDCILISHFHLDHCGGLPWLLENYPEYTGRIFMTKETLEYCPMVLEDFLVQSNPSMGMDNSVKARLKSVLDRVTVIEIGKELCLSPSKERDIGVVITTRSAGHVPGSVMYHLKPVCISKGPSMMAVLYTGDFNINPDRYLDPVDVVPFSDMDTHIMIVESTYASTIRPSGKLIREQEFIEKVCNCVLSEAPGKVLIPALALGKAQEILYLLARHWKRFGIEIPIVVSSERTICFDIEKESRRFIKIVKSDHDINRSKDLVCPFDFMSESQVLNYQYPVVLIASPGMLQSGFSLQAFKYWALDPKNLLLLPGYCAPDTIGSALLQGIRDFEFSANSNKTLIQVLMKVQTISFSAHSDLHGLLQWLSYHKPSDVVLVHGKKSSMFLMKQYIKQLSLDSKDRMMSCHCPSNGSILSFGVTAKRKR